MNSNSPKGRVVHLVNLVYPDTKIEVRGSRVKANFVAEVCVNGRTISRVLHKDWRTAYKSLEIEFSKHWIQ